MESRRSWLDSPNRLNSLFDQALFPLPVHHKPHQQNSQDGTDGSRPDKVFVNFLCPCYMAPSFRSQEKIKDISTYRVDLNSKQSYSSSIHRPVPDP